MAKDIDVLEDMRDHLITLLQSEGVDSQRSQAISSRMQEHFRKHWGGQPIYFKKSEDLSARDMEMYLKYNGRNKDQILREYDLSEVRFYQIIKKARAEHVAKTQKSLF